MINRKNKWAAVLAVLLVFILLSAELQGIISAEENPKADTVTEQPAKDEQDQEDTGQSSELQGDEVLNVEKNAAEDALDEQETPQEQSTQSSQKDKENQDGKNKEEPVKKGVQTGQTKSEIRPLQSAVRAEASQIKAVSQNDPMYWMGQRSAGDVNRAMVWFGNYWQDKNGTKKSPILWRTLRSDGKGNYGGAVTLLSEYVLNSVYFDQSQSPLNRFWCNIDNAIGSSDLRAYMNGVGTGAMDPAADIPSRFKGNNGAYNNSNGGSGSKKGSFYANAFDDAEKNLIVPTRLAGETGYRGAVGRTVADKVFALNYVRNDSYSDLLNSSYFPASGDNFSPATNFAKNKDQNLNNYDISTSISPTYGYYGSHWWTRSPDTTSGEKVYKVVRDGTLSSSSGDSENMGARPAINLDPTSVIFTTASQTGGRPTITYNEAGQAVLEVSNGKFQENYICDLYGNAAWTSGASYRVFARSSEVSDISIEEGSTQGAIKLIYPAGAAGQYVNVLAAANNGIKWTGRVKKITDNNKGSIEFLLPAYSPGSNPSNRTVKIFAWRETEETRTACIPNYADFTIKEAPSYKINYSVGNISGAEWPREKAPQSVVQGSTVTLPPCTFQKTNGTYFVGWQDDDGNMYADQDVIKPEGNMNLTAIWSNELRTLTYDPGKGEGTAVQYTLAKGMYIRLPECEFTIPENAEFIGWNTQNNGKGTMYKPGDKINLSGNTVLYAQYAFHGTITYDGNGAEEESITENILLNEEFELKSEGFTRKGYKLTGWNTESNGGGSSYKPGQSVKLTGSCILYAQWKEMDYKIVFDENGSEMGTAPREIPLSYGSSAEIPETNLRRNKYKFSGWATAQDGSGTVYQTGETVQQDDSFPDGVLTLYAKWEDADKYTISYRINKPAGAEESAIDGSIAGDDVCYNDKINISTNTAKPGVKIKGYVFKGWSASPYTPPLSQDIILPDTEITPESSIIYFAIWASADKWKVTYSGPTDGVTGDFPIDEGEYFDDGFTYQTTIASNSQTRTGYKFLGWSKNQNASAAQYKPDDILNVNDNINLYAVWEVNIFTVKYDRNTSGGSGNAPADQSGAYGEEFTVAAAPEDMKYPGRQFTGWNTEADGSGKDFAPGAKVLFKENYTLYAQWGESRYQIVFDSNGADKGNTPGTLAPSYGGTIKIPTSGLYKKDYIFDGWAAAADGTGNTYSEGDTITITDNFPTGVTTLYAKWKEAVKISLTYDANAGNDTVDGELPETKAYSKDGISNILNITNIVPVRKGYSFVGWSTKNDGRKEYDSGQEMTLKEDTTLYAVWNKKTFTLAYHFNGENDVMYGDLPKSVTGTPETEGLTAAEQGDMKRAHYKFMGWNTEADGSGDNYEPGNDIILNEDLDLYAKWKLLTPSSLIYSKNCLNPETIVPGEDKNHYDDGLSSQATISDAIPIRYGYQFKGWSADPNAEPDSPDLLKGGQKLTVITNVTIYAIWDTGTYTLSYEKNVETADLDSIQGEWPGNITGNMHTDINVPDENQVTREHYSLKGWNTQADGGGLFYTPGAEFSLIANTTLYAIWEPHIYTIRYKVKGEDITGTVPVAQAGKYKSTYQAAQPGDLKKPNAVFTGWNDKEDGSGRSYTAGATYSFERDITLYAQWGADIWTIKFNIDSADEGDPISNINAALNAQVKLSSGSGLKKKHCEFNGWCTEPDGSGGASFEPGASITIQDSMPSTTVLYAKWKEAASYTVTYNKNGDDVDGSVPPTVTCYNDKMNNSTIIPENKLTRKGYTFIGWSETVDGSALYYPGNTIDMAAKGKSLVLFAVWSKGSFKLIYDANAVDTTGTVPAGTVDSAGSEIEVADQGSMYRARYKFGGWNTEADGSGQGIQSGDKIILDSNMILYAFWIPLEPMSITYYAGCTDEAVLSTLPEDKKEYFDDGINNRASVSRIKPIRRGYSFSGWSTEENGGGTGYNGGETIKLKKSLKLYANWEMGSYTLTYNANARDVQGLMPPGRSGTILSQIEVEGNDGFRKPYYSFKGWNTSADGSGATYQPGDHISLGMNTTLYAQWRETIFKIKYDLNSPIISQAQGTLPEPVKGTHLEKFTAADGGDIYCPKYKFTGWNTDPDGHGMQCVPGDEYLYEIFENYGEEVTLYANWKAVPPFEVYYHKNAKDAEGEVPVDNNLYIPEGGKNLATVLGPGSMKRKGYEFVCWTTRPDGSGNKYVEGSSFRVTAHIILYAQWTPGTYTLTYNKNGKNVTGKAPDSVQSSSQENIKIAGSGSMKLNKYEFMGWSTKTDSQKADYKEGQKLRINEDTTLYAVWRRLINVNIEHTEGLKPVAENTVSVSQGTKLGQLELPSVKDGYEIQGWIVNGQKVTNPKDYVLDRDSDVQAIVKKKPSDSGKKDPSKDDSEGGGKTPGGDSENGGKRPGGGDDSRGSNPGGDQDSFGGNGSDRGKDSGSKSGTGNLKNVTYKAGKMMKNTKKNKGIKSNSGNKAPIKLGNGEEAYGSQAGITNTAAPYGSRAGGDGVHYKYIKECIVHWILLAGIFISLIYFILRRRYIRIKVLLQSSFLYDEFIPLLTLPLLLLGWFYRNCAIDIYVIAAWLIVTCAGIAFLRNAYKKNMKDVDNEMDAIMSESPENC